LTLAVAAILFVATLVRATFGFGEALVAVPLLALVVPVKVAAPVAALVSVTVAAIIVARDWRHVHVRSAAWLMLSTLAGIPIGLILLTRAPEPIVKAVLAFVIIAFALQAMRPRAWRLATDRLAWIFGLSAGVLGGAYGMNGPPLAVYGAMRGWSPHEFRATLQGYFLPASAAGLAGYAAAGLWTPAVTRLYLLSLPAVVVATIAGRLASRRLEVRTFAFGVYTLLLAVGVVLLIQAVTVL
jgi:uncharacterized membrane protein YfcA